MKVREEQVAAAKNAKEEQAKADMVELAVYRRDALGLALGGDGIGSLGIIQQQQQAALVQQQQQQRLAFLQHQQHQQQLLLSFGHAHSAGGMFQPGMALQPPAHFALGCSSAGMLPQGLPQQHQVTLLQQQQQLPFGHAHSAGGMPQPGMASQQHASMQQPQGNLGMAPHDLLQQHQATLQQQQQQHAGFASGPFINGGMLTQQTNTKAEQQPPM